MKFEIREDGIYKSESYGNEDICTGYYSELVVPKDVFVKCVEEWCRDIIASVHYDLER